MRAEREHGYRNRDPSLEQEPRQGRTLTLPSIVGLEFRFLPPKSQFRQVCLERSDEGLRPADHRKKVLPPLPQRRKDLALRPTFLSRRPAPIQDGRKIPEGFVARRHLLKLVVIDPLRLRG